MRGFWFLLAVVFAANLLVGVPDLAAAKPERPKATPMKIIKASDTKYKHARIVETKKLKEKRFLWFKKKDPNVIKTKRAPIAKTPLNETVLKPAVEPASSEATPRSDLFEKETAPRELIKLPKAQEQEVEAAGTAESS